MEGATSCTLFGIHVGLGFATCILPVSPEWVQKSVRKNKENFPLTCMIRPIWDWYHSHIFVLHFWCSAHYWVEKLYQRLSYSLVFRIWHWFSEGSSAHAWGQGAACSQGYILRGRDVDLIPHWKWSLGHKELALPQAGQRLNPTGAVKNKRLKLLSCYKKQDCPDRQMVKIVTKPINCTRVPLICTSWGQGAVEENRLITYVIGYISSSSLANIYQIQ